MAMLAISKRRTAGLYPALSADALLCSTDFRCIGPLLLFTRLRDLRASPLSGFPLAARPRAAHNCGAMRTHAMPVVAAVCLLLGCKAESPPAPAPPAGATAPAVKEIAV